MSFKKLVNIKFSRAISVLTALSSILLLSTTSMATAASSNSSLPFVDPSQQTGNEFGYAVSLSLDGNTAVVTAPLQNNTYNSDTSDGVAYVYQNISGSWTNVAQLAYNSLPNYDFGNSANITPDGTKIIVGAFNPQAAESGGNGQVGNAYIYNEPVGGWGNSSVNPVPYTQELSGSNSVAGDNFGSSVALSSDGNTAVVGANFAGAAYIFNQNNSNWSQSSFISSTGSGNSDFGNSVAVSQDGTTVLVGAPSQGAGAAGYAYIYNEPVGGWVDNPTGQKITPSTADPASNNSNNLFGWAVSLTSDGSSAVIGSPGYAPSNAPVGTNNYGDAYSFSNSGGSWAQTQELKAPDTGSGFSSGQSVNIAADGSSMLIGAPSQTVSGSQLVGEAYQYTPSGTGTWNLATQLFPSSTMAGQTFGWSVSVVNNPIYGNSFIGAPGLGASSQNSQVLAKFATANTSSPSGGTGNVFQFETAKPVVSDVSPSYSGAGQQVTISGGHLNPTFTGSGTSVFFGTHAATINSINENQINVTIPVGAVTGKIKVITPNGTTYSSSYSVGPSVTYFSPSLQGEGMNVAIKGYDLLGATATLNGEVLPVNTSLTNTSTTLHVTLPKDAVSGFVTINSADGGQNTSPTQLLVAAPSITGLSTTTPVAGKTLTLKGKYMLGVTSASFTDSSNNTIPVTIVSITSAAVKVTVPVNSGLSGTITANVFAPIGESNSSPGFTIN